MSTTKVTKIIWVTLFVLLANASLQASEQTLKQRATEALKNLGEVSQTQVNELVTEAENGSRFMKFITREIYASKSVLDAGGKITSLKAVRMRTAAQLLDHNSAIRSLDKFLAGKLKRSGHYGGMRRFNRLVKRERPNAVRVHGLSYRKARGVVHGVVGIRDLKRAFIQLRDVWSAGKEPVGELKDLQDTIHELAIKEGLLNGGRLDEVRFWEYLETKLSNLGKIKDIKEVIVLEYAARFSGRSQMYTLIARDRLAAGYHLYNGLIATDKYLRSYHLGAGMVLKAKTDPWGCLVFREMRKDARMKLDLAAIKAGQPKIGLVHADALRDSKQLFGLNAVFGILKAASNIYTVHTLGQGSARGHSSASTPRTSTPASTSTSTPAAASAPVLTGGGGYGGAL